MKNIHKLLALTFCLCMVAFSTKTWAQPADIFGDYLGDVTASNTTYGINETMSDVAVQFLNTGEANDYVLSIPDFSFGSFGYIPLELDYIVITPTGESTYILSRPSGPITFTIPELEIPGMGTFNNVPVKIAMDNNGNSISGKTLQLSLTATATITIIIPISIPLNITFVGEKANTPISYDPVAIEAINVLIANNGLNATPSAPETWDFTVWNNSAPKQLIELNIAMKGLSGEVSFAGLTSLQSLDCSNNYLTGLNLTGLENLTWFDGNNQEISLTLDFNITTGSYEVEITLNNPIFENNAISYDEGILVSSDKTIEKTEFSAETNHSIGNLNGTIYLTYNPNAVEMLRATSLQVYPNPTTGVLNLIQETMNNEQLIIKNVEIFDVYGRKQNAECRMQNVVDISDLPAGIYLLKIKTDSAVVTKQIIKN